MAIKHAKAIMADSWIALMAIKNTDAATIIDKITRIIDNSLIGYRFYLVENIVT